MLNVKLLRKIQKHILEEPKRLVMRDWIITKAEGYKSFRNDAEEITKFPKCGTAACIAGWAVILSGDKITPGATLRVLDKARNLLKTEDDRLFFTMGWNPKLDAAYTAAKSAKKRAKIASKQIDQYIDEYIDEHKKNKRRKK
jgi:hypothetical protein